LGWGLTDAGRFDEARGYFQRSLARVPPELPTLRAQFLFHLGIVEQRRGRSADAEARFREALRLDPEHPAAWIRLGVILWARGQQEEATRAWVEAISLAPRWSAYQLWEIRLAASEMPEAAAVARGRLAFNLVALLPALHHEFLGWDDARNYLDNPHYRGLGPRQLAWMFTTFHMGHYIPVTWMTFGLDYLLWGMTASGYHLTNIFFHTATALAVYFLSLRLLRAALLEVA